MFIEGTIIGLLVGKIRGGKFSNLGELHIRGWTVLVLALLLQLTPIISQDFPFFQKYRSYLYVTSMILLALCIFMNLKKSGMKVFLVGTLLNLMVILFNSYQMPVSFPALKLAGLETVIEAIQKGELAHYRSLEGVVGFSKYLAKFIPISKPYPLPKVFSVGDILVTVGLISFIGGEMRKNKFNMRHRMIKFGYRGRI